MLERASALFRGLRVRPVIEVDPTTASLRFTFDATRRPADIDDTIERLLELPGRIAAERKRRVALVFDEFQEIVKLDPTYPNLMRAVFQTQPEVGHVYLGSRRHVLEAIFNDRNEPFWRSARQMELGPIPPELFAPFLARPLRRDGARRSTTRPSHRSSSTRAATRTPRRSSRTSRGPGRRTATLLTTTDVEEALVATSCAPSTTTSSRVWDAATRNERLVLLALAVEPANLYSEETRIRFGLPAPTFVQRAVSALTREDVVEKAEDGRYRLAEPFLAEWIDREQADAVATARRRSS